jgi:hypothetical protein
LEKLPTYRTRAPCYSRGCSITSAPAALQKPHADRSPLTPNDFALLTSKAVGYDGEHKGTSNWGRYVSDQFCAASGDVQHVAFVAPDVIVECDPPGKMPGSSLRHASLHGDKHGEKLTENPSRNRRQKRESRSEVVKRRLTPMRRNRRPAGDLWGLCLQPPRVAARSSNN